MLNATVVERIELTPELFFLRVKPDAAFSKFHPGQYVAVGLPASAPRPSYLPSEKELLEGEKLIKRAYSIGSSPQETGFLELYLAVVGDGSLTPRLSLLNTGDRLYVAPKIVGTFTVDTVPPDHNLVLLATGTGIAPYLSMIRTKETWTPGRTITIVHGVRYAKDLAYREEIMREAAANSSLRYYPIVSRTDPTWDGPTGHLQRLFEDGTIQLNSEKDHVFLCGNPAMIEDMEKLLAERGYSVHSRKNPAGKLHVEKYW